MRKYLPNILVMLVCGGLLVVLARACAAPDPGFTVAEAEQRADREVQGLIQSIPTSLRFAREKLPTEEARNPYECHMPLSGSLSGLFEVTVAYTAADVWPPKEPIPAVARSFLDDVRKEWERSGHVVDSQDEIRWNMHTVTREGDYRFVVRYSGGRLTISSTSPCAKPTPDDLGGASWGLT
ncbi:hypothetical protein [Nocardia sp. NPDC051832]|uniref:hypothetical protein n=1 Tax=Nocardia sp. NPDC051832 TaxID=3155673 RepID=UPI0034304F83